MAWDQIDDVVSAGSDLMAVDARILAQLRAQGELLDLSPFLQRDASLDVDDFYANALDVLTHEGRVWAIPAGIDVYVMYLNQDLFELHGVPYPDLEWTWIEFLDRALALQGPEAKGFGYTTVPGHWDAVLFVYQHGGRIVDSERASTRIVCDDPLALEALEWYAELFHQHNVAPTPAESRVAFGGGAYTYYQAVRGGKVGMWALPLSQRGGMMWPVEWLGQWRVAVLPKDERRASTASLEAYAISADTDHPDAAWRLITFLSRQVTLRLVPPRQSLVDSEAYEQLVGEDVAIVARASLRDAVYLPPELWTELGADLAVFSDAVGQVVEGKMTASEAMEWAHNAIDELDPAR
jgi:multiple sugar transport system substrate-binding protein